MKPNINIADLFCGAGGTSTGALEAIRTLGFTPKLTAINHWDVAIATHSANYPEARHLCTSLDNINPRSLFAEGELEILWASPECTHHSQARGGKPINDQGRSTAWCVVRWAEALRPNIILVENVPEFETWGGIGTNGRPLKGKKGATFLAWVTALESLGYSVEWRVLCSADYGDPTTRRRLFVQAVRGRRKNVWPEPTHAPTSDSTDMFSSRKAWATARDDVIDWKLTGQSIYDRKRPLSPKTMARIMTGLQKFGFQPHLVAQFGERKGQMPRVHSVDQPVPTVTAQKGGPGLAQPFLIHTAHGPTGVGARSVNEPMPTVAGNRGDVALIEPGLLPQNAGGVLRPVSEPAPTVACDGAIGLVQPYLIKFYGTAMAQSVDSPLDTVTTKDRHALVRPTVVIDGERYLLDIRFRMLQPHELAAAQGFRSDYIFTGNKTERVKQIGNAVTRRLARALCLAVLGQTSNVAELLNDSKAA